MLICVLPLGLTACSTVKQHMPALPNEATYGMGYRFQTDSDRDILDGGYLAEIHMYTNTYHYAVRTPNFTQSIKSDRVEGARDSWRANGIELAYGRPLWQTDPNSVIGSTKFSWELNGGFLIAQERRATDRVQTLQTAFGPQEVRVREQGDTAYLPTAGVGLHFSTSIKTPGGGQYSSVGLGVQGGYRVAGEFGGTPYIDVGLVLGL